MGKLYYIQLYFLFGMGSELYTYKKCERGLIGP